ncbi:MAG: hypothetical protein IKU52_01425 [Clostridia bacterium]|nr:hypothetical protein [Clostridia bacterium]
MKNKVGKILVFILCLLIILPFSSCKKGEAPDEAAMVYKNVYTSEAFYSYWISCHKYDFLENFNKGVNSEDFWNSDVAEGKTYGQFTTDYVMQDVKNRTVALWLFDQYGLTLSKSVQTGIDNDIKEKIEYYGSREALNKDLAKFNMNIDMLREVYVNNAKYDILIEYLYSDKGTEAPTDSEKAEFLKDNYICIKMISVFAEDYDALLEKIEAGEDFDELCAEYSEIDYSAYPNGIFIYNGDSASESEIVKAAFSLEVGEMKTVTNAGTEIVVLRCEMPLYSALSQNERELLTNDGFENNIITEKKNTKFEEYIADVKVNTEITDKYPIESVSRNSYF